MFSISIWLAGAPSGWNFDDAPSRSRVLPFEVIRESSFDSTAEWLTFQDSLFADTRGQIHIGRPTNVAMLTSTDSGETEAESARPILLWAHLRFKTFMNIGGF